MIDIMWTCTTNKKPVNTHIFVSEDINECCEDELYFEYIFKA
jgi:hypothetical protein